MSLILFCLLLIPFISLSVVYVVSKIFGQTLAQTIDDIIPEWEAAGFNREGSIRIAVLAKKFSGLTVREHVAEISFKSRVARMLHNLWAKVRGHEIIEMDDAFAEKLKSLSEMTGQDAATVTAHALAFLKQLADNQDAYTALRDKEGNIVKQVLNKDLLTALREGRDPFE